MKMQNRQLFGEGVKAELWRQSQKIQNLLATRLIADLVKGLLLFGPLGLEKMMLLTLWERLLLLKMVQLSCVKLMWSILLPKLLIEASNAVDNAVGDGATSVVVLAGATCRKSGGIVADMGIPPTIISDQLLNAVTNMAIEILRAISVESINSDK